MAVGSLEHESVSCFVRALTDAVTFTTLYFSWTKQKERSHHSPLTLPSDT